MFNVNLPIYEKRNDIVKSVKENDITIITAETGSGKSTQVPQYLYKEGYDVIVTQPRRIACVSLATRVAEEMGNSFVVGYHTAFESTKTADTKVLFCTGGLQMAKSVSDKATQRNTVLIIDEVHEWSLNTETLVAWVKNEKKLFGSKIKVVLMSATVDVESLVDFYKDVATVNAISVPNRNFEVSWNFKHSSDLAEVVWDKVSQGKNVLVFQPGKKEIEDCIEEIKEGVSSAVKILPMHGELSIESQKACFRKYSEPKVVVATNIAQTSITIDDIDVVVDTGTEKVMEVEDGIEGLCSRDISKADCLQRAGRAGRTKAGEYYLCSDSEYKDRPQFSVPEMQRLSLDKVVLKLLSIDMDAEELEFFHQPSIESIKASKMSLKFYGATDKHGRITDIGRKMVKLPTSSKCSRMLIEAEKNGVLSDMITIISVIENGSLINFKKIIETGWVDRPVRYSDFTDQNKSDLIAELDIYNSLRNGEIDDPHNEGINLKNYYHIREYRNMLERVVKDSFEGDVRISERNNDGIIRSLLVGMADTLYRVGYREYYSTSGMGVLPSKGTCVLFEPGDYAIGMPITIETTNRYGSKRQLSLLQNITVVSRNMLVDFFGVDVLEVSYDKNNLDYLPESDLFAVDVDYSYKGFVLKTDYAVMVGKDSPDYAILKEIYDSIDGSERSVHFIEVNGSIKKIYHDWYNNYIEITFEELKWLIANNKKHFRSGTCGAYYVTLRCKDHYNTDAYDLYQRIIKDTCDSIILELKDSLPEKSGKVDVISSWLDKVGVRSYDVDDDVFNLYVGLARDKGSLYLNVFTDEENSTTSTKEALEFLVKRGASEKYSDKTFKVKNWEGKKVMTKESEAARDTFKENLDLVVSEVSVSNFVESMEYLDDVYNELIEGLAS